MIPTFLRINRINRINSYCFHKNWTAYLKGSRRVFCARLQQIFWIRNSCDSSNKKTKPPFPKSAVQSSQNSALIPVSHCRYQNSGAQIHFFVHSQNNPFTVTPSYLLANYPPSARTTVHRATGGHCVRPLLAVKFLSFSLINSSPFNNHTSSFI